MRLPATISALSALLLLAACATYQAYPGQKRPRCEIAVLSLPSTHMCPALDGEAIKPQNVTAIEFLPGWHTIEWEFIYPNGFTHPRQLVFEARAGQRYRLGQRFFPTPNPLSLIGDAINLGLDTATRPLEIFLPPETPTEPPEGAYYSWIVHEPSRRIVAGLAPDVPLGHVPIVFVPRQPQ